MNSREEALEYFKKHSIWDRILKGFRGKYESYGEFSGRVRINAPTLEDIQVLEGFFGKNFHGQKSITISAERFKKALKESRYGEDLEADELLLLYFDEIPIYKKEEERRRTEERKKIFSKVSEGERGISAKWLDEAERNLAGAWNICNDAKMLKDGCKVLNLLDERKGKIYLPVLASAVSKDPHYFDDDRNGLFLDKLVEFYLDYGGIEVVNDNLFPMQARWKNYEKVGIRRDELSSDVILYGVRLLDEDGSFDQGMEGFIKERKTVKVPYVSLRECKRAECRMNTLYIVENHAIFSIMKDAFEDDISIMCCSGYPGAGELKLLSIAEKGKVRIRYSGDTDPEGILIADRLKSAYRGDFSFFNMDEEDYLDSMSDVILSDKRLLKLDSIRNEDLKRTAEAIKSYRRAGYQENIMSLFTDIKLIKGNI